MERVDAVSGRRADGNEDRRRDRAAALAVALLGIVRGLPFLLLGPKFVLDDWFTLFWAWQDGWWRAAGPIQPRTRPLGALVYTVEFGVIGRHPGVIAGIQVGLSALTAALFFLVCRRFLSRRAAVAVAVLWLVLANHSSLDHWASGMIAQVALVLLLTGVLALIRAEDGGRRPWAGTVLVALSAMSYEATIVAAAVAVVAVPLLCRRRLRLSRLAWQLGVIGATGLYLLASSYHLREDQGWFDLGSVVDAHFGSAVLPWSPFAAVLTLAAVAGTALACARPASPALRRHIPAAPARLVATGVTVIAVGLLPFLRYPIAAVGVGDRANVVASLGTALMWTGLIGMAGAAAGRRRTVALVVAALVAGSAFTVQGVRRDLDWHRAGVDTDRTLAAMAAKAATLPPGTIVVAGPRPRYHRGITGLVGSVPWHLQTYTGNPALDGEVAMRPEAFARVPAAQRVDIDALFGRP